MRDPARIPVILDRLRVVWEQHPDMRLGQFIRNSRVDADMLWQIECEPLVERIEAEGIVARPRVPMFTRKGERVIVKIKAKDFRATGGGGQ